ncbi:hypothetical protein [Burkholderia ambifaria]|jgi:transposase|uniref:hypothetical protein n=1 Tax=Burkholderia ambifaria TaxID=152480 RepID=UPI001BA1244B|nr:hypothetical protein [Burkholderia ambifaria]MBR8222296.1 hypothetical protein [Burkholderia ambifaria]
MEPAHLRHSLPERRRRLAAELAAKAGAPAAPLLPVNIIDMSAPITNEPAPAIASSCEVEIEVGKRRVRIRGRSLEFAERFLRDCLSDASHGHAPTLEQSR